ncbi:hypothetical protein [Candidatus Ichthyocystis sparus]|uniref:hypothetical protein n=1 Tax=Candidatus Ichthyocystis sparus TaxID=1561004 RepID=UPI000B8704D8|nr:hypothetical protein [Candidatus Ichthyocystis sparus]
MLYIDNEHYSHSENCKLEVQIKSEVSEDTECTEVMITKNNSKSTISYQLCRFLSDRYVTPLILLSMSENANGYKLSNESLYSHLCKLEEAICQLINLKSSDPSITIMDAVNKTSVKLNEKGKELSFNFSSPLILPSIFPNDSDKKYDLIYQLSYMGRYIRSINFATRLENLHDVQKQNDSFCDDFSEIKFCDESNNVNDTVSDNCCSNINLYIIYSNVLLTTIMPEIVNSTISTNLTKIKPTPLAPDKPIKQGIADADIVLIVLLLITLTIFSFIVYRCCKKQGIVYQHGSGFQPDNIDEVAEDLV